MSHAFGLCLIERLWSQQCNVILWIKFHRDLKFSLSVLSKYFLSYQVLLVLCALHKGVMKRYYIVG